MDKSRFNSKVSDMCSYSIQDKSDIRTEKNKYPFSSLLQIMDLLGDKAIGTTQWESRFLPKTMLYLVAESRFDDYLRKVRLQDFQPLEVEKSKPAPASAESKTPQDTNNDDFDIMKEINSYQEVSFKTAPKSVILSKFLETGNYSTDELGDAKEIPIEVLGKKSITENDALETETLALVLEKQKKFDKAIEVYEKLISRNPEKSSIFAPRILELKNKLENSK